MWMRSSQCRIVATDLGSIPASSDTVESEGRQMKQCWISYIKRKITQKSPINYLWRSSFLRYPPSPRPGKLPPPPTPHPPPRQPLPSPPNPRAYSFIKAARQAEGGQVTGPWSWKFWGILWRSCKSFLYLYVHVEHTDCTEQTETWIKKIRWYRYVYRHYSLLQIVEVNASANLHNGISHFVARLILQEFSYMSIIFYLSEKQKGIDQLMLSKRRQNFLLWRFYTTCTEEQQFGEFW